MAKVEDCPGFETFGADVKAARQVLAEIVGIEWRYLANIENKGTILSLPVVIQLIKVFGLPVEQYFNPEIIRGDSVKRCAVCGAAFTPKSNRAKYCPDCAVRMRRKQEAERQRKRYLQATQLSR